MLNNFFYHFLLSFLQIVIFFLQIFVENYDILYC